MNAVPEFPARPGPTILRVPAVRWMTAELVPFGCLAIGFAIAREWRPTIALGYLIALFGMPVLTAFYLYKVLAPRSAGSSRSSRSASPPPRPEPSPSWAALRSRPARRG
jgi:hypothetical protein